MGAGGAAMARLPYSEMQLDQDDSIAGVMATGANGMHTPDHGSARALWDDSTSESSPQLCNQRGAFVSVRCGRAILVQARVPRVCDRPAMITDVSGTSQTAFGIDSFPGIQEDIVASVVSGKDVIVLMATGSGTSLCFQLPALCSPGRDRNRVNGRPDTWIVCSRHRVRGSPLLRPSPLQHPTFQITTTSISSSVTAASTPSTHWKHEEAVCGQYVCCVHTEDSNVNCCYCRTREAEPRPRGRLNQDGPMPR
jgi:hypothetical protein